MFEFRDADAFSLDGIGTVRSAFRAFSDERIISSTSSSRSMKASTSGISACFVVSLFRSALLSFALLLPRVASREGSSGRKLRRRFTSSRGSTCFFLSLRRCPYTHHQPRFGSLLSGHGIILNALWACRFCSCRASVMTRFFLDPITSQTHPTYSSGISIE